MLELTWGGWIYIGVSVTFLALAIAHLWILIEIGANLKAIYEILGRTHGF